MESFKELRADLRAFSPLSVSTALAFYVALGPRSSPLLGIRPLLRCLFPEIASYLLFRGREVPRDCSLEEAVEQCADGGLILVRGDHQLSVPLQVRRSMHIEGVMSVRSSSGSKKPRLPMIQTRLVLGAHEKRGRGQGEKQIELCNLHLFRPAGLLQGKRKEEEHQSMCFDIGIFIYPRTHVTSRSCIIEESPVARSGYGVFVRERASWTASHCAVRQAEQVGVLVQGRVFLDHCQVSGSKIGISVEGNTDALPAYGGSGDALLSCCMVNCLLYDNQEMGIKLPMHNIFPGGSFAVSLANSTIEGSTYPVAQDQTTHGYYEWVESIDDMVGLLIDEDTLLLEPSQAEERRPGGGDDDDDISMCSFITYEDDPEDFELYGDE